MNSSGDYRLIHQWNPLFPIGDGWQLALVLLVLFFVAIVWAWLGGRETKSRSVFVFTWLLRLLPLLVLAAFCLNPQRISEQRQLQPSEVAVLLDTSLSMNLRDEVRPDSTNSSDLSGKGGSTSTRFETVMDRLQKSQFFEELSKQQKVSVFGFDERRELRALGEWPAWDLKSSEEESDGGQWINAAEGNDGAIVVSRWNAIVSGFYLAAALLVFAILLGLPSGWWLIRGNLASPARSWINASGIFGMAIFSFCSALGLAAFADLLEPGWSFRQKLEGWVHGRVPELEPWGATASMSTEELEPESDFSAPEWIESIRKDVFPSGTESRIGDALHAISKRYVGRSLASIVLISDGNQNAGEEPTRMAAQFGQNKIAVQVLGVGSLEPASNAMLVSLDAPAKVLPASPFKINGFLRSYHQQGSPLKIELCSIDEQTGEVAEVLQTLDVMARADGEVAGFEFEMNSAAAGRTTYLARVQVPGGDFDPNDDSQLVEVAVVDRKNHVLLMAGGPSREFRFLRNQLYRDPMVQSDVWLQSMDEGADQEAAKLLTGFPTTADDLDQYDCVIAFDPDWRKLSPDQAKNLEQWVSQRGGGLISIAGPVFTPEWSTAPRGTGVVDPIRRLYPVSFFSQGSAQAKVGRFGGKEPFPLEFTREGSNVDFVALTSDPLSSRAAWDRFEGVYGYYAVNEAKPGAQVFAYFSDPATMIGQRKPIYMAAQFVGKGRVFFQASGEMWRIRNLDVNYFQTYYTKLIRWASQGRLLRDSMQGTLVVDKQRSWLGDTVQLEAQLVDAQGQPLAWPDVNLMLRRPDGVAESLKLIGDVEKPGEYRASLPLREEGQWRFFLPVPEAKDGATLQASVAVQLSDLEKRESQRNDMLLHEIAELSGGTFLDVDRLDGSAAATKFLEPIPWRQLERIEPGTRDIRFSQRWLGWMFGLLFAYFCCGWFYRRMNRLA